MNLKNFLRTLQSCNSLGLMSAAAIQTGGGRVLETCNDPTPHPVKGLSNYDQAKYFISIGWKVFPCYEYDHHYTRRDGVPDVYSTKSPRNGTGGFNLATTDPVQVAQWWRAWPRAMVGIPGESNGLIIQDFDRHEGDPDGIANYLRLLGDADDVCQCFQLTLSSGVHSLYKAPELPSGYTIPGAVFDDVIRAEFVASNPGLSAAKLNKRTIGIDFRYKGYICTGTARDGRRYSWINGLPTPENLGTLPAFVVDKIVEHNAARIVSKVAPAIRAAECRSDPVKLAQAQGEKRIILEWEDANLWESILKGWTYRGGNNWQRPEGQAGRHGVTSRSAGKDGFVRDWFYNYSESSDLPSGSYSKWSAFVTLQHNGDFKGAFATIAKNYSKKGQ